MNLQDLRDELAGRADSVDRHPHDLLPGVQQKIRRTKQRRAFTALGVVAAIAVVAAGLVPSLTSTTPPAEQPPVDYTRDGVTVPGAVGNDKLLKAWIGDRGQDRISFTWTPETAALTFRAECRATGSGIHAIRFTVNGWYVGSSSCDVGPDSWSMGTTPMIAPDHPLWLDSPVGKPAEVTAEIIDLDTRRPGGENPRIALGIYATAPTSTTTGGAPLRTVAPGPDDYQKDGVTYRKHIGGDTLAGAQVADRGEREVRFSFTATGANVDLRPFCTANKGSDSSTPPYRVTMRVADAANGGDQLQTATCGADSVDAGVGTAVQLASPVRPGHRVDVIAYVTSNRDGQTVPPDLRLGLGVYNKGKQRIVGGVPLPERIESAGYNYRLTKVQTAPGPGKKVSIRTPDNQPYAIAYGSSPLGITTHTEAHLTGGQSNSGLSNSGLSTEADTDGSLGVARDLHGPAPAADATLTITQGTPTKGILILAIYRPE